ncbi:alpha/beta hydrolase [Paucibacter sediminis]|uniref:Alpha/beta hydrolase n=1 Tax=Paucibacter sediminis TaxID=3019553 RepID=A0AA95NJF2_9BURK|nr:alpha/beta hydrolase [Paucibacter sp. S2-9]WIT13458.1 alpha/beta hydrolase [Paucibacter sp. S2-9]
MSMHARAAACLLAGAALGAQASEPCGTLHSLATHAGTSARYALAMPAGARPPLTTLVLLAGGSGHVDLDERSACARALKGNALVRSQPLFVAAGFATVVLDAPSDQHGEDGLAGFRSAPAHAQDLALLIAALRQRMGGGPVWLVGTSRGTISAANAAARLSPEAGPDGLVLSSALMAGQPGARKPWVAQSVFDLPLQAIRQPLLLIAHEGDSCPRSPPALMPRLAEQAVAAARVQQVLLRGGPGAAAGSDACEGRAPHGFVGQEAELVQAVRQFIVDAGGQRAAP